MLSSYLLISDIFFFFSKNIFRLRKIKAIFVIGVPVIVNGSHMDVDKDAQIKIELEYAKYGDILQVIFFR
jgi:hypothetical protein